MDQSIFAWVGTVSHQSIFLYWYMVFQVIILMEWFNSVMDQVIFFVSSFCLGSESILYMQVLLQFSASNICVLVGATLDQFICMILGSSCCSMALCLRQLHFVKFQNVTSFPSAFVQCTLSTIKMLFPIPLFKISVISVHSAYILIICKIILLYCSIKRTLAYVICHLPTYLEVRGSEQDSLANFIYVFVL